MAKSKGKGTKKANSEIVLSSERAPGGGGRGGGNTGLGRQQLVNHLRGIGGHVAVRSKIEGRAKGANRGGFRGGRERGRARRGGFGGRIE
eukprot:5878504-Pyramimonas_sp.AAC.2